MRISVILSTFATVVFIIGIISWRQLSIVDDQQQGDPKATQENDAPNTSFRPSTNFIDRKDERRESTPTNEKGTASRPPKIVLSPQDGKANAPKPSVSSSLNLIMPTGTKPDSFTVVSGLAIEAIDVAIRRKPAIVYKSLKLKYPRVKSTLKASAKKVWIDLGARQFVGGSTMWFIRNHPDSKEFHGVLFELLDLKNQYTGSAQQHFQSFEYFQFAAWINDGNVTIKGIKMARVHDENSEKFVKDGRPTWSAPSKDLAAFLLQRYQPDDYVLMKMDIEGGEWIVIPHLIRTGAIHLIDELLLECHPQEPNGTSPLWMHQSCVDFFNWMRALDVFCHRWV